MLNINVGGFFEYAGTTPLTFALGEPPEWYTGETSLAEEGIVATVDVTDNVTGNTVTVSVEDLYTVVNFLSLEAYSKGFRY